MTPSTKRSANLDFLRAKSKHFHRVIGLFARRKTILNFEPAGLARNFPA
jgi:hypothetical protein